MPELVLDGCRPTPLAHYLKALGILRLVAEQKDPSARGCWRRDRFVLCSALSADDLERFFLEEYRPTPIVAPWNGGSGFYPKDNRKAIDVIEASSIARLSDYRETIAVAKRILTELGIADKEGGETKALLLEACRAAFPDHSLTWLDATYVLSSEGPKYPPLLGTGGNDGRLDFTNNFMQRLLWVLDASTGQALPAARGLLRAALTDAPTSELVKGAPIGQFLPSSAGGANVTTGFGADSLINPWDFILMLEGAAVFATATVRRTERESLGALSYPFTVRTAGVGYGSAAANDESSSRAEMWLPLWERPAKASEILTLLSEGRARVGHRTAQNGVDFARAVAGLGVDRGIQAFQRYGFQVRNGLAYFAIPLARFAVRAEPRAGLLQEIDGWLESFRRRAGGPTAPASAERALRQVESSIFELCAHGDNLRLQEVLIALGRCEQVLARSTRWTEESFLHPVPALSPEWLRQVDDGSVELRLAASLASITGKYGKDGKTVPLRRQLEPVATWRSESGLKVRWDFDAGREVAWTPGNTVQALNAVLARRLVLAVSSGAPTYPDRGRYGASLGDVADFIEGRVDDQRLADLLWGCTLLDWTRVSSRHLPSRRAEPRSPMPGALYALLKLCFPGPSSSTKANPSDAQRVAVPLVPDMPLVPLVPLAPVVPLVPRIHRLAAAGHASEASREAIRRLRGSGVSLAVTPLEALGELAVRSAAALLFPLDLRDRALLRQLVARPERDEASVVASASAGPGAAPTSAPTSAPTLD